MVAKPDIDEARKRIETALEEFFQNKGESKVLVSVNPYGRLHALVASHGIVGRDRDEVRGEIRDFLKEKLAPGELAYLYRIHLLTSWEYDDCVWSSGAVEGITLKELPNGAIDE